MITPHDKDAAEREQCALAVIEHLGPAALSGGKMSVLEAFEKGWLARAALSPASSTGAADYSDSQIAEMFHQVYEELAPFYGYETRPESRKPWAEVPEKNRLLMMGVIGRVRALLRAAPAQQSAADQIGANQPASRMDAGNMVLVESAQQAEAEKWISVTERLPLAYTDVLFVVDCPRDKGLHGRILGGRYVGGPWGFSVPGMGVSASHWMPMPKGPAAGSNNGDAAIAGSEG